MGLAGAGRPLHDERWRLLSLQQNGRLAAVHVENGDRLLGGQLGVEVEIVRDRCGIVPEAVLKGRQQRGKVVYQTMWGPSEFFMTGTLAGYDRSGDLHRIGVPALYSCGRFDEAAPDTVEWYSSLTPNSEFVVYENSAHMPHWEDQQEYIGVVHDFLRKVDEA